MWLTREIVWVWECAGGQAPPPPGGKTRRGRARICITKTSTSLPSFPFARTGPSASPEEVKGVVNPGESLGGGGGGGASPPPPRGVNPQSQS